MSEEKRILVIEDHKETCRVYARTLGNKGFLAETAFNIEEARNRILEKTYHVALIDIMLGGQDDMKNTDGIAILKILKELNEGTVAIVLSAHSDTQLIADTLQEHGAKRFIAKQKIAEEGGLKLLINEVNSASKAAKFRYFGSKENILSFLAGKTDERAWVSNCLITLKPSEGYVGLREFFKNFLNIYLPLIPLKASNEYLPLLSTPPLLHGSLWSKALGKPVEILVSRGHEDCISLAVSAGISFDQDSLIKKIEKCRLTGCLFEDKSRQRSDFEYKL